MADHLPECGVDLGWQGPCICPALRACELRTLSAARDAVAALAPTTVVLDGPLPVVHNVRISDALAAIDALRGEA